MTHNDSMSKKATKETNEKAKVEPRVKRVYHPTEGKTVEVTIKESVPAQVETKDEEVGDVNT